MKITSAFFLVVALPAVVVYGKDSRSNKSTRNSRSNKNSGGEGGGGGGRPFGGFMGGGGGGGGNRPSAFSQFLGGFRTVIDILKTGDASNVAQASKYTTVSTRHHGGTT